MSPKNVIIAQGSRAWSEPEAPLKLTAAASTLSFFDCDKTPPIRSPPFYQQNCTPDVTAAPFVFRPHRSRQGIASTLPIMATGVDAKLLKSTKFPPEFSQKVDMTKVNLQVMKK